MPEADEFGLIDFNDEERNMYGCAFCPQCGDEHRYARKRTTGSFVIVCDECGYQQTGKMKETT